MVSLEMQSQHAYLQNGYGKVINGVFEEKMIEGTIDLEEDGTTHEILQL